MNRKPARIYPVSIMGLLLIFTLSCKKDETIDDPKDEPIEDPAEFEGGIGTRADPYLIATPEQLDDIRNYPNRHFKQIADIDLSGYSSGEGWQPIGGQEKSFSGTFDGNGYKITNLSINSPFKRNIGLFGYTGYSVIKNVVLEIYKIAGLYNVGGLVGENSDRDSIINSYVTGNVFGDHTTGGLVGMNVGNIKDSYSSVDVSGINSGGLVGINKDGGYISNCYASGDVSGYRVGGLIGSNVGGYIRNSYATGDVLGSDSGGLVGSNSHEGDIINCYATGIVSGDRNLGGLVGVNFRWNFEGNTGYSYYNKDTSGQDDTGKGIPKTTGEMMQQSTFGTWNFTTIWRIEEGNSYPYFRWKE